MIKQGCLLNLKSEMMMDYLTSSELYFPDFSLSGSYCTTTSVDGVVL
jgi:hypothetical protein